jgi:hypothetical protein
MAMLEAISLAEKHHKPFYFGEFGGDWRPEADQKDEAGVRLRSGLWLSLVSECCGSAMPWWWDTAIDPNDLWTHWRPIAGLARKIDRRDKPFDLITRSLVSPNSSDELKQAIPASSRVQAIVTWTEGLLYLYDPRVLRATGRRPEVTPRGGRISVNRLLDGTYDVEFWDATSPTALRTTALEAKGGTLTIDLPMSMREYAVYFKSRSAARPGIEP